jgi:FkbM family methyltransferase
LQNQASNAGPDLLARAYDAIRLVKAYGPLDGPRIIGTLLSRRRTVSFKDRGRTYVIPNELSARYHLLESTQKLRRLADFVRPEDRVIVDIGAHAGLFAAFATERARGASVLCVEPDPRMSWFIAKNLAHHDKWDLASAAASDREGDATFYRARASQESSLLQSMIRSDSAPISVATVTLDELCADKSHVDVLKMDVQGAELDVLAGGTATISRVRTLLVEVTLLDTRANEVLNELSRTFGPWRVVNSVYAGADLLFERPTQ